MECWFSPSVISHRTRVRTGIQSEGSGQAAWFRARPLCIPHPWGVPGPASFFIRPHSGTRLEIQVSEKRLRHAQERALKRVGMPKAVDPFSCANAFQ